MNIRNKVFLVLITFSTFVGCKKDLIESNNTEYVVMSDVKSLDFKQEGETKIIDLMANSHEYWTIDAPSETWVKAVKKGNSIEVTTEPNLNSDDRKMRLTISVVGGKMSFVIKDRKSTRLNSSHANISYAVFCLKKKKKTGDKLHLHHRAL